MPVYISTNFSKHPLLYWIALYFDTIKRRCTLLPPSVLSLLLHSYFTLPFFLFLYSSSLYSFFLSCLFLSVFLHLIINLLYIFFLSDFSSFFHFISLYFFVGVCVFHYLIIYLLYVFFSVFYFLLVFVPGCFLFHSFLRYVCCRIPQLNTLCHRLLEAPVFHVQ